ncbi:MAG TPA: hypothetical protein VMG40_02330 [Bryobacteraceae bacterium]|nr:hypothetical protein [Bryobacteraceae bacterium]
MVRLLFLTAAVAALAAPVRAQSAPQSEPKLAIERLALHQYEDGPMLPSGYEFVPGETAYFSCRIAGFATQSGNEARAVKLRWHMRLVDPSGVPIDKDRSGAIEESLSAQDKDWVPKFLATFSVPAFAPSGTYHIPVTIQDEVAGAETTGELSFEVRGHDVQPSDTLTIRNFAFVRAADDKVAMRPAIYTPGDTLWAKFDITGYKFGEGNQFSVDYGLAILNANGDQVFAQPAAASDAHQSFYPQRYVPGELSLHLDNTVAKAPYTLVIIIHDKVGNQNYETRQPFQVQ